MEMELLKLASSNGIWAVLFTVLFLYFVLDSRQREKNLSNINKQLKDTLQSNLKTMETITQALTEFGYMDTKLEKIEKEISIIRNILQKEGF